MHSRSGRTCSHSDLPVGFSAYPGPETPWPPGDGGGDGRGVVAGELVVSRGDAMPILGAAEGALDEIA